MQVFHVTTAENVESIWNEGILSGSGPTSSWAKRRATMREMLDSEGNDRYSSWVDRQDAVFFWGRYTDAVEYAQRVQLGALVEVDVSDYHCWAVHNQVVEELFEVFEWEMQNGDWSDLEEIESLTEEFFEYTHAATGTVDSGYEVWTDASISPDSIIQITDLNGDPFDI